MCLNQGLSIVSELQATDLNYDSQISALEEIGDGSQTGKYVNMEIRGGARGLLRLFIKILQVRKSMRIQFFSNTVSHQMYSIMYTSALIQTVCPYEGRTFLCS